MCGHRSDQLHPEEVELLTEQRAGAADLPEGLEMVLTDVGDRLVIGPELVQLPQPFDMAVCLLLQAATRTQAVQIAIEIEFQELTKGIARAPCRSRHGSLEATGFEVEFIDEGIEEADRMVLGNVIVEALGEEDHVVAVCALDMAHRGTRLRDRLAALFIVGRAIVPQNMEFSHMETEGLGTEYSLADRKGGQPCSDGKGTSRPKPRS